MKPYATSTMFMQKEGRQDIGEWSDGVLMIQLKVKHEH